MTAQELALTPDLRVPVRQRHIDEAIRANSTRCAIANALKEAIPRARSIKVDTRDIRWSDPVTHTRHIIPTPIRTAVPFIVDWDQKKPVTPFTLRIQSKQARQVPMGWSRQRSDGATRKGKKYRKTGRKNPVPKLDRVLGIAGLKLGGR